MSHPLVACRYFVAGRVQGVFFRASTARQAEQLGLRGFARNLPDGRVEVLAIGAGPAVATLAEWLRTGPPRARVDSLEEAPEDPALHAAIGDFRTG